MVSHMFHGSVQSFSPVCLAAKAPSQMNTSSLKFITVGMIVNDKIVHHLELGVGMLGYIFNMLEGQSSLWAMRFGPFVAPVYSLSNCCGEGSISVEYITT
jgi:hypothetical protein